MEIPPEIDPSYDPNTGTRSGFLYTHKAFRRMWLTVVGKVDTTDWQDQEDVKALVPLVYLACHVYIEHNELETKIFLNPLSAHVGEVCERWLGEHTHHIAELQEISKLVVHLSEIPDDMERRKQGIRFSDKLHLFLASDLTHMSFEENQVMSLIDKHLGPSHYAEVEAKVISELNPVFVQTVLPFFLLGGDANANEFTARTFLNLTAKLENPAQAWTGFCNLAKAILAPKALAKLQNRVPALDGTRR
jgi:hypothetical protein